MVGKTNVAGARLRAVIAVTYPEGSVCTCSNGTKTLKARDTSGKALFNVSSGTWTVTATDGNKTKDATVDITTEGQVESVTLSYDVYYYDNGNEYSSVTGGWVKINAGNGGGSMSKNASSITISAGWGQSVGARTTNKVSLNDIKTLYLNLTSSTASYTYCGLSNNTDFNAQTGSEWVAYKGVNSGTATYSLDVSSLTGTYYIVVAIGHDNASSNSISINSIYGRS